MNPGGEKGPEEVDVNVGGDAAEEVTGLMTFVGEAFED